MHIRLRFRDGTHRKMRFEGVPTVHEKEQIAIGDAVCLGFVDELDEYDEERMWVVIEHVYSDGSFHGKLVNEPTWIHVFILVGEDVVFQPRHVLGIQKK